jgi:hypothetical protein
MEAAQQFSFHLRETADKPMPGITGNIGKTARRGSRAPARAAAVAKTTTTTLKTATTG